VNYWLHPEAQEDLREAAEFYREQAGTALSQSFLAEFEHSVGLLLQYPSARSGAMVDVVSLHDAIRSASFTR
jgi:plasmid stabilization system protein ParE